MKSPIDLPVISHDAVDRLFAFRQLGRGADEAELLNRILKIHFLNEPGDLAVLLARLGQQDAWEKLLQPLMNDEVAFVENPPRLDTTTVSSIPDAHLESSTKSERDGVTTYLGPILKLSAGPWRITCDQLTAYRNAGHGMLLSGSGKVRVEGVLGLFSATADEVTLNTETGDLKLAGHVHLDGWTKATDCKSCTITRAGEVKGSE